MRPKDRPGGRLSEFWEEWRSIGASQTLLDTLRFGHSISLKKNPTLEPPSQKWATILEEDRMITVRDKVSQLALKGVIEDVSWDQAIKDPGLYSRLFCVPKRTSKGERAVIDLSRFNDSISWSIPSVPLKLNLNLF